MESKGHFCYGCNEFFHDSNCMVVTHKGCKGKKSLGICVDSKEFGEYHPYNLENHSKLELIQIIQKLSKQTEKSTQCETFPLAFLTKANKLFMKSKTEVSSDGTPRYIPNPNANGTYSLKICKEGYTPIYDKSVLNIIVGIIK